MWDTALSEAASNGLYALLFVALLVYTIRRNDKRELKYQETIDKLADKFQLVKAIKDDVDDIKDYIRR